MTDKIVYSQFGERLKQIRRINGWSQEDLAAILNTSKQVISRYERGERSPKISTASEYAQALGISLNELNGSEPKALEFNLQRFAHDSAIDQLTDQLMQLPPDLVPQLLDLLSLPPAQLQRVLDFASGLRAAGSE